MTQPPRSAGQRRQAADVAVGIARLEREVAGTPATIGDERQNWIFVHTARGVTLTAEGKPHLAVAALEQAYAICTQSDIRLLRPVAAGFAIFCGAAWYLVDRWSGHSYSSPALGYWNTAMQIGFFLVVVLRKIIFFIILGNILGFLKARKEGR